MMLSRPRNIVMVCSVVVFCVAVMGCSSSDDGKTRELEGQLDMANQAEAQAQELIASLRLQIEELAQRADITPDAVQELRDQVAELSGRADITDQDLEDLRAQLETLTSDLETAEQGLETAEAARMAAERGALADMQAGGVATASHVMAQENWEGNLQGQPWWSSDAATWWAGHRKHGAVFHAAPWINPDGELEFYVDIGTFRGEGNEVQTTPVAVHPGRDMTPPKGSWKRAVWCHDDGAGARRSRPGCQLARLAGDKGV